MFELFLVFFNQTEVTKNVPYIFSTTNNASIIEVNYQAAEGFRSFSLSYVLHALRNDHKLSPRTFIAGT